MAVPDPARPPVFLHSGWRGCSTYVWSKFRALDEVRAYYEPFHEALAALTREAIDADSPETSKLRHPKSGAPYMAEFEALLAPGGGVAGYHPRFALDSYFMAADADDAAQAAYVGALVGRAQAEGRAAVLGCCRTLGRAAWLKRRFGGVHIVLMRDPISQWASGHAFRKRADRESYFERCAFAILGLAGGAAAEWGRAWGVPARLAAGDPRRALKQVRASRRCHRASSSYAAFAGVYVLAHAHALASADLVLDMDRLSADPAYAKACEAAIARLTGLRLSFDDCRAPGWVESAPALDYEAVHAAVWRAFPDQAASPHAADLARRLDASAARVGPPAPPPKKRGVLGWLQPSP